MNQPPRRSLPARLPGAWAIAGLLAAFFLPALAGAESRNVLVLYGPTRLLPAVIEADRGIREALGHPADRRGELYTEFLDVPRFHGEAYARTVATFLREKYAAHPPNVTIVGSDSALELVLRHRESLFPNAPIVYLDVAPSLLRSLPALPSDVVGTPVEYDSVGNIELAFRLRPRATRLVLVTGASEWDRRWEVRLRGEVARFPSRATPEFLSGEPTEAVLRRLAELGDDAVVFTPGYFEDGAGRVFAPREAAQAMAAASAAPVFGPFGTFLGTGVVGGYAPDFVAMGRRAGQSAAALLDGATPASLRVPAITPTALNIDWRQIDRWGFDPDAIPEGATVHFREPSLLEAHRTEVIVAVVVFLLQAALITGLLVERRRRRLAEQAVQAQRADLAHASRLAVAGELTGAIAHEINQPLGAILSNADTAELLLESGTDRRDELRAILADIRRDDLRASEVIRRLRALLAKNESEREPLALDDVVSEMAPVLRAEAKRRGVTLDLRPAASTATIVGDRIQIQQVLINLVLNAMDAVAEVPEDRRNVVVAVETAGTSGVITVRDRGHGIAPEHMPKVFDSFFTTKREGMGLGLSIVRTLVEAHGGRVRAESAPAEGTVFRVEVPLAGAQPAEASEPA